MKDFETSDFTLRLIGESSDGRANRWRITCKTCKKHQEPQTTLMRYQRIQCACGVAETIDYNTLKEPTK